MAEKTAEPQIIYSLLFKVSQIHLQSVEMGAHLLLMTDYLPPY